MSVAIFYLYLLLQSKKVPIFARMVMVWQPILVGSGDGIGTVLIAWLGILICVE